MPEVDIEQVKSSEYLYNLCQTWLELQKNLTNETNAENLPQLMTDISLYDSEIALRLVELVLPNEFKSWSNSVIDKIQ